MSNMQTVIVENIARKWVRLFQLLRAFAYILPLLYGIPTIVNGADSLENEFAAPPDTARPWVYWFWINGNITREAITADLEAMKQQGIGGVLIMEADAGEPKGPVPFAGPRWRELFKHAGTEAQRLGLQVNMNN